MDCHDQFANWSRNDIAYVRGAVGGGTHGSRPTFYYICFVGQGPCALPGMRGKPGRADVGIGPYGVFTDRIS